MNDNIKWKQNKLSILERFIWEISFISSFIISICYIIIISISNNNLSINLSSLVLILIICFFSTISAILPFYIISWYTIEFPQFIFITTNYFLIRKGNRMDNIQFRNIQEFYIDGNRDCVIYLRNSYIAHSIRIDHHLLNILLEYYEKFTEIMKLKKEIINKNGKKRIIIIEKMNTDNKHNKFIFYTSIFIIISGFLILFYNTMFFYFSSDYLRMFLYLPLPTIFLILGYYLFKEANKNIN